MGKEKKDSLSIANVLAVIGVAAIGIFTFFGFMFKSEDGNLGTPILLTAVLLFGLTFFLIMAIKAKRANNNPDKWKIVECICIVGYLVVAFFTISPFLHFFEVQGNKTELQKMAESEITSLDEILNRYNSLTDSAATIAQENLINYVKSGQSIVETDNYMAKKEIGHDEQSILNWIALIKASVYIGPRYKYIESVEESDTAIAVVDTAIDIATVIDVNNIIDNIPEDSELYNKLASIKESVSNWKLLDLSNVANKLIELDTNIKSTIDNKIETFSREQEIIPVFDATNKYIGVKKFNIKEGPEPKFANALRTSGSGTPLGWILFIVSHLLVILSYVVAQRSNYIRPTSNNSINNGIDL